MLPMHHQEGIDIAASSINLQLLHRLSFLRLLKSLRGAECSAQ